MGWRFRKSFKIFPGVRLNFGKRGFTSTTVGGRWFKTNVSGRGLRHTLSAPGTGVSYQTGASRGARSGGESEGAGARPAPASGAARLLLIVLGILLALALVLALCVVVLLLVR